MKLLFEDERFHNTEMKIGAQNLLNRLALSLKQAWPDAPGFAPLNDPQDWAEKGIKLKQALMISPRDYRIHYCMPGSPYDPAWMEAEDAEGFPVVDAQSRRVVTCLFPALTEQDPSPFGENPILDEILVVNKKFFPTFAEKQALDPKMVICKAVVLVS